MKVADAVAQAMVREGVTTVFGLMGDANMSWMIAMAQRPEVELVHVRHENAGVAMADGHARITGGVGVCTVTSGPGVTQIGTSLAVSAKRGTPLVVVAGETPAGALFGLQAFDAKPFVEAAGALHYGVTSSAQAMDQVRHAFYLARTARRPVVLTLPFDVMEQDAGWVPDYEPSSALLPAPQSPRPDPEAVDTVARLLASATRPVVLAGHGAVAAGAHAEVQAVAERLGALLCTSLHAKDWFDGHPLDAGVAGAFASPRSRELFAEADVVLGLGARLGYFTTEAGYLFPEAEVIQVDLQPHGFVDGQRAGDHFVVGDVRQTLLALSARLDELTVAGEGYRQDPRTSSLREPVADDEIYPLEEGTMDTRAVAQALQLAVPREWRLVIGVGHFWNFLIPELSGRGPGRYQFTHDFGTIGQAMPCGIGVAKADPSTPVVVVEGDGSLLMNIQELETIARHDIPVLVMVVNDGAFGAEVHKLASKDMPVDEAIFGHSDFAGIARGFGLVGHTVTAPEEIEVAVKAFAAEPRPTVLDLRVSASVVSRQYRRLFFGRD